MSATAEVQTFRILRDGEETDICVEWRGPGDRWAVTRAGRGCLSRSGVWDYEPLPSSRTDTWKAAHRFEQVEAIRLALAAAERAVK